MDVREHLLLKVHIHCSSQVIGSTLRDCIATDHSLWVVSQALDCVFDIFGDDNCPLSLFASLSLMPVLRQCASTFKARVSELYAHFTISVWRLRRTNCIH